ncbi:MAG TPA: c-type cytochrome [Gemmatimonadales bacterium]|jgi:cytochrome c2
MSRLPVLLLVGALACGGGESSGTRVVASTAGDPVAGKAAIAKYGCGSCHTIPGVARARGLVGPPLTDFAQRSYIAGRAYNTPANLEAWIRVPDSVEPGTAMPTLGVSREDARNITAYLYLETATRELGPPHLLPATLLPKE